MYNYHKTHHKSSYICECENRSLLRKGSPEGQKSVLTELHWASPRQSSETADVGSSWKNDWKASASAKNFRKLMEDGGPKKFFQQLANCKTEEQKIQALQKALKRYGNKSTRDILIELRLAEDCMALDARIFSVLKKVGVHVSPDGIYMQVEKELREKVAEPLGISAALLDRILFKRYDDILKQL